MEILVNAEAVYPPNYSAYRRRLEQASSSLRLEIQCPSTVLFRSKIGSKPNLVSFGGSGVGSAVTTLIQPKSGAPERT